MVELSLLLLAILQMALDGLGNATHRVVVAMDGGHQITQMPKKYLALGVS